MKRNDIKVIIASVLMLAISCSIGAGSVSALSAEGESLLSALVSVGTSAGLTIDGILDMYASTTTQPTTISVPAGENAQEELDKILDKIGIGSDILIITDLVSYLNRGGSFADWIYSSYGKDVEIPDSVKAMSTKELALYLMGKVLYPDQTQESKETTTKYVYPSEEQNTTTSSKEENTETTKTNEQVPSDILTTEQKLVYKTGDVNSDGKVTATDSRLALRASALLDTLEGAAFHAADVNGDGRVTANDARSILRYSAKITSGF